MYIQYVRAPCRCRCRRRSPPQHRINERSKRERGGPINNFFWLPPFLILTLVGLSALCTLNFNATQHYLSMWHNISHLQYNFKFQINVHNSVWLHPMKLVKLKSKSQCPSKQASSAKYFNIQLYSSLIHKFCCMY